MEKDFHYYCTAVLSKAAGFNEKDALTIAYAAQYVDDCSEGKPIKVGPIHFDPIRTAHQGIQVMTKKVQKLILIPFHFIPPKPIISDKDEYQVSPNSAFSQLVLNTAINDPYSDLRLFRIGIALHLYADTWAHQGFSGRLHPENNVESLTLQDGSGWKKPFLRRILFALLPQIGHAEATGLPDKPYLCFKFSRHGKTIERNNPKEFFTAAKKIYQWLLTAPKEKPDPIISWDEIKDKLQDCLSFFNEEEAERCQNWKKTFGNLFKTEKFHYDSLSWRKQAFGLEDNSEVDWDDFHKSDFKKLYFQLKSNFYNSSWVKFHQAAALQRQLVLKNLPKSHHCYFQTKFGYFHF